MNKEFISGKKTKIAILGCGRISQNHIKAILHNHERAELVALCDLSNQRLAQAESHIIEISKELSIKVNLPYKFNNLEELLSAKKSNKIKLDLVTVATPSGLHSIQTIQLANAGINVCCEKPMATKLEDGVSMLEACNKNNIQFFLVKQNRLNSTLDLVKRQIELGRFGQLSLVTVNVFWQRPQSYYDKDSWRGTLDLDGGALMNQASHYVDLLEWLIGPLDYISASCSTLGRKIEAEDTAALQMKWLNGALGTMAVTMLTYPKNLEGSITILGEHGSVKIGGKAVNKIEYWYFKDNHPDDEKVQDASYETTNVYGFGHLPYYVNLLNVLQKGDKPLCDAKEGLKSLEILIAAYRSAKSSVNVKLPLIENK